MGRIKEIWKTKKCKKGEYGFIEYRKKWYSIKVLLYLILGLSIFILGLFLNKMSPKNIFSVAAMLMVLPGAKALVGFIVLFPYCSVEKKSYDRVKEIVSSKGGRVHLFTSIVITSPEKVMNLSYLAEGEGAVIGLLGKKGQDLSYIQTYLAKGVSNWASGYKTRIFTEEAQFLKAVKGINPAEQDEGSKKTEGAVLSYLSSLIVE